VDLIASILEIDPKTVVEARVELAENTLRRLRSILKRGMPYKDPRSSTRLWRSA